MVLSLIGPWVHVHSPCLSSLCQSHSIATNIPFQYPHLVATFPCFPSSAPQPSQSTDYTWLHNHSQAMAARISLTQKSLIQILYSRVAIVPAVSTFPTSSLGHQNLPSSMTSTCWDQHSINPYNMDCLCIWTHCDCHIIYLSTTNRSINPPIKLKLILSSHYLLWCLFLHVLSPDATNISSLAPLPHQLHNKPLYISHNSQYIHFHEGNIQFREILFSFSMKVSIIKWLMSRFD